METKTTYLTGKAWRKPTLIAALLLTAFSLSACVIPADRGGRGDSYRHHHWNNDDDWRRDNWQGGGWDNHH